MDKPQAAQQGAPELVHQVRRQLHIPHWLILFGLRVQGSGFRVQRSGFRVQGLGFRVWGLGMQCKTYLQGSLSSYVLAPASALEICNKPQLPELPTWRFMGLINQS